MINTLLIYINFSALLQALILIIQLVKKKYINIYSNRILALILLSFSVIIGNTIRVLAGYEYSLEFYDDISNAFSLLISPYIFIYTRVKLGREENAFKAVLIHSAPFILYMPVLVCFKVLGIDTRPIENTGFVLFVLQSAIYVSLSVRTFRIFRKEYKKANQQSVLPSLLWMERILISYIITYLLGLTFSILRMMGYNISPIITLNIVTLFSIHIFILTYKSISQPEVLFKQQPYLNAKLSNEKLNEIYNEVIQIIELEKLYLDVDFSLKRLADQLNISTTYISQAISRFGDTNFTNLLNSFRVEDFKQKLSDSEYSNLTLVGVAEKSGFKSSSAFYAAFKKLTGITPSDYKKQLREKE